jgi:hypothetical protein
VSAPTIPLRVLVEARESLEQASRALCQFPEHTNLAFRLAGITGSMNYYVRELTKAEVAVETTGAA